MSTLEAPAWLRYANQGAVRNLPLSPGLLEALSFLDEMGLTAEVFSGGQDPSGATVGGPRHNHGNAADMFLYRGDERLDWSNPDHLPVFEKFVSRARDEGITGIGAGPGYMQPGSLHVGFGDPAVWGADGKGANAPEWLRAAYYGDQPPVLPARPGLLPPPTADSAPARPEPPEERGLKGILAMLDDSEDEIDDVFGAFAPPPAPPITPMQAKMIDPAPRRDFYSSFFRGLRNA